jgi:hypothetical protein
MTDEMRAAESLVRDLAPPGLSVPIPEPFALDESTWFLTAVDKGLVEFTSCPTTCTRTPHATRGCRDHFEPSEGDARHLFGSETDGAVALHRDYLPCLASYARAVFDFGYAPERASLLHRQPGAGRLSGGARLATRIAPPRFRADVSLFAPDGSVHLQIKCLGDRQRTRRLATTLDACGRRSHLSPDVRPQFESVLSARPRYLWLVGPNTIEPAGHVFRLTYRDDDIRFTRIERVPDPAGA